MMNNAQFPQNRSEHSETLEAAEAASLYIEIDEIAAQVVVAEGTDLELSSQSTDMADESISGSHHQAALKLSAAQTLNQYPEAERPTRLNLTPNLSQNTSQVDLKVETDVEKADLMDLEVDSNLEAEALSEAVQQALQQGDDYLLRDQFSEAIAAYQQAVELAPELAEAHQCLAEALMQAGELEAASLHYAKALEFTPLPTEMAVKQTVQALIGEENTDPIDRLPWYEQGAFYLQQGQVYCDQEKWGVAIANCEKAIDRLGSHSATAYRLLGRALQEEKRLDEASSAYQKSLMLQSKVAETHARVGSLLAEQGDLQAAVRAYQEAIAVDSKFAGAYFKLGEVWQRMGDASQAADCWHEALLLQPAWASPEEHLRLGSRLTQQGKLGLAIARYQQLIELSPGFAETYYQLAGVFGRQGEWQSSMESYEQATELEPSSVVFRAGLGRSLAKLERWQDAIACCHQIMAMSPEPQQAQDALQQIEACQRAVAAESYERIAREFVQQQQWQEAVNCYRMAVQRNSASASSQAGLGLALAGLKQWQEALGCYQAAVKLEPQNVEYGKALAAVLLQLGQFEAAARYYRSLVDPSVDLSRGDRATVKSEVVPTENLVLSVEPAAAVYSVF